MPLTNGVSGDEANQIHQGFNLLPDLIKFALGVLTGWFAHVFATRRDAATRIRRGKDEFLKAVAAVEVNLPEQGDVIEFHRDSLKPIRAAVLAVQPFVTREQFSRLDELWIQYRDLEKNNKLNWISDALKQILDDRHKTVVTLNQKLSGFYKEFKKTVG